MRLLTIFTNSPEERNKLQQLEKELADKTDAFVSMSKSLESLKAESSSDKE